jgi:hypothetical protein
VRELTPEERKIIQECTNAGYWGLRAVKAMEYGWEAVAAVFAQEAARHAHYVQAHTV